MMMQEQVLPNYIFQGQIQEFQKGGGGGGGGGPAEFSSKGGGGGGGPTIYSGEQFVLQINKIFSKRGGRSGPLDTPAGSAPDIFIFTLLWAGNWSEPTCMWPHVHRRFPPTCNLYHNIWEYPGSWSITRIVNPVSSADLSLASHFEL